MNIKIVFGIIILILFSTVLISFHMYSKIQGNKINEETKEEIDLKNFFKNDYNLENYSIIQGEYKSVKNSRKQGDYTLWISKEDEKNMENLTILSTEYIPKLDALSIQGDEGKIQTMIIGPINKFIPKKEKLENPLYLKTCYLEEQIEFRNERDFKFFIKNESGNYILDSKIDKKKNCIAVKLDSTSPEWGIFSTENEEITNLFLK